MLDYVNCKCRRRLIDKLVEKCTENNDNVKIAGITLFECNSVEHKNKCKPSCTIYVVLIVIVFVTCIGIGTYFAYKYMNHWYLKNDISRIKFNNRTQTTIY